MNRNRRNPVDAFVILLWADLRHPISSVIRNNEPWDIWILETASWQKLNA